MGASVNKKYFLEVFIACLILINPGAGNTCEMHEEMLAQYDIKHGWAEVSHVATGGQWSVAQDSGVLCAGGRLSVGTDSEVEVQFPNSSLLTLRDGQTLTLSPKVSKPFSWPVKISQSFQHLLNALPLVHHFVNAGVEHRDGALHQVALSDGAEPRLSARLRKEEDLQLSEVDFSGALHRINALSEPSVSTGKALIDLPFPLITSLEKERLWTPRLTWILDLLNDNHYLAAYQALKQVSPHMRDAEYHHLLTRVLLKMGHQKVALESLLEHAEVVAKDGDLALIASKLALHWGSTGQAFQWAQIAERIDGERAVVQLHLSFVSLYHGRVAIALESASKAVEYSRGFSLATAQLALSRLSNNEKAAALRLAQQAVNEQPENSFANAVLGFAQMSKGEAESAQSSFQLASRLDPSHPLPRQGLAFLASEEFAIHTQSSFQWPLHAVDKALPPCAMKAMEERITSLTLAFSKVDQQRILNSEERLLCASRALLSHYAASIEPKLSAAKMGEWSDS